MKIWCGNVFSTSERNYQTFNKIQAKSSFGRHVGGREYALQHGGQLQYKWYCFVEKSECHKISPLNAEAIRVFRCSICSSEVSIRKLSPKSVVMWEYIYFTWNYASRADTQVSQKQNTYSVNLLLTLFVLLSMELYKIILLHKRKSQKKCLNRSYYWRQYKKHWGRRKIIKLN